MDTLGFLELSSIVTGISVADEVSKAANINLLSAKASCPGKYYILINGTVSNVTSAIDSGVKTGKSFIVSSFVLPRVHEQVIRAINLTTKVDTVCAVGAMEFFNTADSIIAADTAVKSADVQIIDIRLGTGIGGKSFVVICGDIGSVQSAIDAGSDAVKDKGMLVNKVVIAHPDKRIVESLF